jgi:hypothetical protein
MIGGRLPLDADDTFTLPLLSACSPPPGVCPHAAWFWHRPTISLMHMSARRRTTANPEVLYVHNSSANAAPLPPLGAPGNSHHAWVAQPASCPDGALGGCVALATFNAGDAEMQVAVTLTSLNLTGAADTSGVRLCGRDLWARDALARGHGSHELDMFKSPQLSPHGAGMYVLWCAHSCADGADMFA